MDDASSSSECPSMEIATMKCEVCLLKGHGNHFGVITCRACAAFFRRMTVGTGQRQKCHFQSSCAPRNGRWFCKKCRLEKCRKLGMTPENIQHNRDLFQSSQMFFERQQKRKIEEDAIPLSMEKWTGIPSPIIHLRREKIMKRQGTFVDCTVLINKLERILKKDHYFGSDTSTMTTLEKLAFGLKELRKTQQQYPTEIQRIGKEETCRLWESQLLTTAHWIMYFDEFRELPFNDQLAILKCMWHIWSRLERLAMTAEMRVNRLCGERQFIVSHDAIIDYDKVEFDVDWSTTYTSEELKCFINTPAYYAESLMDSYIEVKPSDIELVFLLCNICLRLTGKKLGGQFEEITERLQAGLADNLHTYYTEKEGLPRYAHRLTKLLNISNDWQGLMNKRKEKFIVAFILDQFHVSFSHPELFQYSI